MIEVNENNYSDVKVLVPEPLHWDVFTQDGNVRSDIVAVAARKECRDIYMASEVTHESSESLGEGNDGDEIIEFHERLSFIGL